ncbi:MAG: hypothetical protein AAB152_12980 [Candidatus Coatesbacteria bacterium]
MSLPAALAADGAAAASSAILLLALAGASVPGARWLRAPRGAWPAGAVFGLVVGAGTASLLLLGAGLAGLFQPPVYAALVAAGAAGGIARVALGRPRRPSRAQGARPAPGVAANVLLAAVLGVTLPMVFLPEISTDCLIYHLAAPEQFLVAHRISSDAFGVTFKLPLPGELLFGWSVVTGNDAAARVLPLAAGFLAAAALLPLAGLGTGTKPGWLVAALLLASSRVLFDLRIAKPDLLALAAFAAALLAADRRRPGLAWGCLGLAAAFKLTFVLAAPAVPLWGWLRRGEPPRRAALLLAGAWIAALPLLPWWLKNWWFTGNPLFFALTGVFPTLGWLPGSSEVFRGGYVEAFAPPGTTTWGGAAAYALARLATSAPGLSLAALLAVRPGAPAASRRILGLGLLLEVLFIKVGRMERFPIPADFLVAVSAALALPRFLEAMVPRLRALSIAVLMLAGAVPIAGAVAGIASLAPLPCLLGAESPAAFLARSTGELAAVQAAVRIAGPRVLLLASEQRAYRFGCRIVLSTAIGPMPLGWTLARDARGPGELAKRFRQLGITHVAYNFVTAGFQRDVHDWFPWTDRMARDYASFVRARLRIARSPAHSDHPNGGFYLYEVLARPLPSRDPVFYLPGAEGVMREVWQAERREDAAAVRRELGRLAALLPGVLWVKNKVAWQAFAERRMDLTWRWARPGCLAGMVDDENWSIYAAAALGVGRRAEGIAALRRAAELYPEHRTGIAEALEVLARGTGNVEIH